MSTRRNFMFRITGALGAAPLFAASPPTTNVNESLEAWLSRVKGTEKLVFDVTSTHDGFPNIWSWAFLDTHKKMGTADAEVTAVLVLRHLAVGAALDERQWKKYGLGKMLGVVGPVTNTPATRHPYWDPPHGELPESGMAMKNLLAQGVLFCVCQRALANLAGKISRSKNLNLDEVQKELVAGLLPDVQQVPSGVWALQKLQQLGCAYCFAG